MNTNERLNKLMDIYEPYVQLEFIRDENGNILEIKEVFKNNITPDKKVYLFCLN